MNHSPRSRRALLLALFATTLAARAQHIGVGTLTPGERLDVVGGNIRIKDSGRVLIFPDGTTQGTAATGVGFIQNTTSPQAGSNFSISGRGTVGGAVQAGTNLYVDAANGNSGTLANGLRFGGSSEGIGSQRTASGSSRQYGLDFYTGSANRMTLSQAGQLGIGISDPTSTLDVRTTNATARITVGTTGGGIAFGNPGHGIQRGFPTLNGDNNVGFYTTAGNLYLAANGPVTNQFVLTSGGSVGIGTPTRPSCCTWPARWLRPVPPRPHCCAWAAPATRACATPPTWT